MSYRKDAKLETFGYNKIVLPYLKNNGYNSIWIHDAENEMSLTLQSFDIDIITEKNKENMYISLKVVRGIYDKIFIETVKNCNSGEDGWLFYTFAQEIWYLMTDEEKYRLCIFKPVHARILFLENRNTYQIAYGENKSYRTEGVLIPIADFHDEIVVLEK